MTEEKTQAEETAKDGAKVYTEELKVAGDELVARVKDLIREGNVNRIIVKDDEGRTLVEVPLALGMVGMLVAPVWAALGALAALAARFTIVIQRVEE